MNRNILNGSYDTDKLSLNYLDSYDQFFAPLLDRDIRMLELGIFKGGSMLLWRDYFKKGVIAGLDLEPPSIEDPTGRIRTYRGSQADTSLLDRIAAETAPEGFDIIIDDCSHIGEFTRISFRHLFDHHLKPGGIYSIEDWGTGYWGDWPDGRRYPDLPRQPSGTFSVITRLIAFMEKFMGRDIPSRWVSRLYKPSYYKQRFPSHDYGMVGFIKQLIDEAAMADITCPVRGTGASLPSGFRSIHISLGQAIIVKSPG